MTTEENIYGNVWIFNIQLLKDEEMGNHKHEFDHIHQTISGVAEITVWDKDRAELIKYTTDTGKYIKIPKGYYHRLVALEDYHGNCIHAVRDEDNNIKETDYITDIKNGDIYYSVNR